MSCGVVLHAPPQGDELAAAAHGISSGCVHVPLQQLSGCSAAHGLCSSDVGAVEQHMLGLLQLPGLPVHSDSSAVVPSEAAGAAAAAAAAGACDVATIERRLNDSALQVCEHAQGQQQRAAPALLC
jgi:hypothetical protein